MRVAMYYSNSDLRLEERSLPKIGEDELLLRVEACGICGSDVMQWYRINRVPLVLGHEISATVVEKGSEVRGFSLGDRVVAAHHVPCNDCYYCKNGYHTVCDTLRKTNFDPGGFSEYVRLPQINVRNGTFILPDEISFDEATLVEPLACVLRAQRVAGVKSGQSILVIGSGIAGLLHVCLAKINAIGCLVATDLSDWRLAKAKELGADLAMDARDYTPDAFREANYGRLADVVILCTGNPSAINQAFDSVDRAGTIIFFAPTDKAPPLKVSGGPTCARKGSPVDKDKTMPFSVNKLFWRQERKLVSSYAGSPQDHIEALDLIKQGKLNLDNIITHRLPLEDIGIGFKLVAEAKESLKVIIKPQERG